MKRKGQAQVEWQSGDVRWFADMDQHPLEALAGQRGMTTDERRVSPDALRQRLGLPYKPWPVVDTERLLSLVPGDLAHRGAEALARRYYGGESFSFWYDMVRAVERQLEALQVLGRVRGGQGERGNGWTRVDEAYIARQRESDARRAERERRAAEREQYARAVAATAERYGVHADRGHDTYSAQAVGALLAALGVALAKPAPEPEEEG